MKFDQIKNNLLHTGVAVALVAGMATTLPAYAGGKITIDDTKWISVGMGIRGNFVAAQNAAPAGNDYSTGFGIPNARIYLNGQIHKYVKFEFNTECFNCSFGRGGGNAGAPGFPVPGSLGLGLNAGGNSTIGLLDAIAKFEFNKHVNLWAGRMLVPTSRAELNGPFYHATFEGFKTPFFPADYSFGFGGAGVAATGNSGMGLYGRDNGVTFWGEVGVPQPFGMGEGQLQYSAGVFNGTRSAGGIGPNQSDAMSWAGRLTYNFLNPEKNPGYYTSGTYYGNGGDILAIAIGVNHQKDGAGSVGNRVDFTGIVTDLLFEKVLDNNMGVITFNGEYKRFWAPYTAATSALQQCICVFSGQSWQLYGLYLIPHKVGIGRFQPYGRFVSVQPDISSDREEIEGGVNYVIDGHNARISAFYQHGDLFTKSLNYTPGAAGMKIDKFSVAFQIQI